MKNYGCAQKQINALLPTPFVDLIKNAKKKNGITTVLKTIYVKVKVVHATERALLEDVIVHDIIVHDYFPGLMILLGMEKVAVLRTNGHVERNAPMDCIFVWLRFLAYPI